MGASENRAKNSKMAADLVKRGYYHGRRFSSGLSNIPDLTKVGSAAYRRMVAKRTGGR
jgi:hypothetical protein